MKKEKMIRAQEYIDRLEIEVRPQLRLVYEVLRNGEDEPIPESTFEAINITLFHAFDTWHEIEQAFHNYRNDTRIQCK